MKSFFSVVDLLAKQRLVGSVTDASSCLMKLMTASTSAVVQTAAAPSSRECRNMTFHLIKSSKNSDHPAWLEQCARRAQELWDAMLLPPALSH